LKDNHFISVVTPVYKAEKILRELVKKVEEQLQKITDKYELILVEDCSPDNSWQVIEDIARNNSKVKAIKFCRNFGQHPAIKAGIETAQGECCIVMDCDLQDDPAYIPQLFDKWKDGNDVVYTCKEKRKHSIFKNFTAILFYKVFNYLVGLENSKADNNVGSYSLISRKVMNVFLRYNDYQFHYLMVLRWIGFKSSYITIQHKERYEGKSSYSFRKLIEHAAIGIVYQSNKLLHLNIMFGFIIACVALLCGSAIIYFYFANGFKSGWASLFVLQLFMFGVILISIGFVGVYIGKIFAQVKNRPQYLIDNKINFY